MTDLSTNEYIEDDEIKKKKNNKTVTTTIEVEKQVN